MEFFEALDFTEESRMGETCMQFKMKKYFIKTRKIYQFLKSLLASVSEKLSIQKDEVTPSDPGVLSLNIPRKCFVDNIAGNLLITEDLKVSARQETIQSTAVMINVAINHYLQH